MPTYSYRCTDCDYEFTELILLNQSEVEICPQCGGDLERVYRGLVTAVFKGSGFYETDYAGRPN